MEDVKVILLSKKEVNTNDKKYYILKIYLDFSDVIFDCFVSKKIYDDVSNGLIDNDNIIDYCHFKVDSNRVFSVSIYK